MMTGREVEPRVNVLIQHTILHKTGPLHPVTHVRRTLASIRFKLVLVLVRRVQVRPIDSFFLKDVNFGQLLI